jgi:hypothetical protein
MTNPKNANPIFSLLIFVCFDLDNKPVPSAMTHRQLEEASACAASAPENDVDLDLDCQTLEDGRGPFTDKPAARCEKKKEMKICDYAGPVSR